MTEQLQRQLDKARAEIASNNELPDSREVYYIKLASIEELEWSWTEYMKHNPLFDRPMTFSDSTRINYN
jgi:hypothetical protein